MPTTTTSRIACMSTLKGQFWLVAKGIGVVDLMTYLSLPHCRYLSANVMNSCGTTA
jgi:hypothetical protein